VEILTNPGVIAFGVFFVLLALNFPVAVAVGGAAVLIIWAFNVAPLNVIPYVFSSSLDSFSLLATPLFVLVGTLITRSGIATKLVRLAEIVFGTLPGGLAIATIVTGALLGSMSGSNVATVAALSFLIGAMFQSGYPKAFAVAVVAAGCTFGVVIPPSLGLIIYGVITETSVPKLFAAGVGPGLVMAAILCLWIYIISRRHGYRGIEVDRTLRSFYVAVKDSFWALMTPVLILGGIYGGVFTPTEAAAVAVVYLLVVDRLIYRQIPWSKLPDLVFDSGKTIGVVVLIIATAAVFAWILQTQGLATKLASGLLEYSGGNRVIVLLFMNIVLLIAGAFIEPIAAMYLFIPLFKPVLLEVGVDLIHFGAIMTVNLSMAHLTPPVGLSLYLASQIGGVPFASAAKWALPFVACEIVALLLVTYVPPIAMFLPSMM
jgi:C4-dicarboxylate transporter DctM subunit